MDSKKYKASEVQPTVLRLHPDLRSDLTRLALRNGRSLSKEIALRLEESLKKEEPQPGHGDGGRDLTPLVQSEPGDYKTKIEASTADRAMLAVFRKLPAEKQLALLSLFR